MFLSDDTFKAVISATPLVSIDLVIENSEGQYLLGHRANRPAQGLWFVPGGRILKDESIADAFSRLTNVELGLSLIIDEAVFYGVYEHFYDDCAFGDERTTHYVVLAYKINLDISLNELPRIQHNDYKWFLKIELLNSEVVHEHSKWYLLSNNKIMGVA